MNEESTQVTLLVTTILEDLDIAHVIGGSLASALHGVARSTLDSDLVADIRLEQIPLLVQRLQGDFYVSTEAMIEAVQHRTSFNLIHLRTMFKVDIFIPKDRPFDQAQLANRKAYILATEPDRTAYVASAEDTILAKLEWFRMGGEVSDRQWRDILGVALTQGDRLDFDYLQRQAVSLGVADLLARLRGELPQ
jgi:hypothetical protein